MQRGRTAAESSRAARPPRSPSAEAVPSGDRDMSEHEGVPSTSEQSTLSPSQQDPSLDNSGEKEVDPESLVRNI